VSKADDRRPINIGRYSRPTLSADRNRSCVIEKSAYLGRSSSADKKILTDMFEVIGGNPAR